MMGNNDGVMDLIEKMAKNEGIAKIVLQDDYENYMYLNDLLKYIKIGKESGYRDMEQYEQYLEINPKKLEGLLSILNRYFGERSSDVEQKNENKT